MKKFSKYQVATAIAIIFHFIGLTGILYINRELFIKATSLNLALMFLLLLYTQKKINTPFILFIFICFITGITVEIIGTNTGLLFGKYVYGNVLGPQIKKVPLIIGINWFIIIYCCGVSIHSILTNILEKISEQNGNPRPVLKTASIIFDGASLALLLDWIMEPVAVKLGFWTWLNSDGIPLFNYLCWFVISSLLLAAFHFAKFDKQNKFAVNLLLIQLMFFLVLRTLL